MVSWVYMYNLSDCIFFKYVQYVVCQWHFDEAIKFVLNFPVWIYSVYNSVLNSPVDKTNILLTWREKTDKYKKLNKSTSIKQDVIWDSICKY